MGVKGLQITIAVSIAATVTLVVGLSLEFQRIAFSIYGVPSARILVHLRHAEFEAFAAKILQELFRRQEDLEKFQDFTKTRVHDLQDVKDVFCGLNSGFIHGEIVTLCQQFTADYYGGLVVMTVSIITIVLEMVGCCYLAYYLSGRTKKGYRRTARILFVFAPVAEATALMMYCVAVAVTSRDGGGIFQLSITWTPGCGLMLCSIACCAFFIIAFLHKQWKLEQIEFLNEQRLTRKHKVEDKLMGRLYEPEPQSPAPFSYNCPFSTFLNEQRLTHKHKVEDKLMGRLYEPEPQSPAPFSYNCAFSTSATSSRQSVPQGVTFPYSPAAPRYTGYNNQTYPVNTYDQHHLPQSISEVPPQYNQHLTPGVVEISSLASYDHSRYPSSVACTR